MKKTIITAMLGLALPSFAAEESLVYNSNADLNNNLNSYGFYFSLNSAVLTPETGSPLTSTLTGSYTLDSFTTVGRTNSGATGEYGLFVLEANSNTIIGFSTSTQTAKQSTNLTFSFVGADGSSALTLNANTQYRILHVDATTWGYADANAADVTALTYSSGTSSGSYTLNEETNIGAISGGLKQIGVRTKGSPEDSLCNVITNANGTTSMSYSIGLSDITITKAIPEPATATLSLLALAGLAARRRRK